MRHPEPQDYIKAYHSGFMSEHMMLDLLINYEYTYGYVPTIGDYYTDAWVPGTYDQVEHAYYVGDLTKDQFAAIFYKTLEERREWVQK